MGVDGGYTESQMFSDNAWTMHALKNRVPRLRPRYSVKSGIEGTVCIFSSLHLFIR